MGNESKICEHIYNHTLFGDKCEFSGIRTLAEFFSSVPQDVQKLWPFDFSEEGYRTNYERAVVVPEQLGFVNKLHLKAQISNDKDSYAVCRQIYFEDNKLVFVHDSLLREKGEGGVNFANLLMSKTWRFLQAYDQTRQINYKNEYSEIFVQARSVPDGKIPIYGGYIWANQGFDFRDKSNLPRFRDRFRDFLATYGVNIEQEDLRKFTKPCHFAAFGCGVQAEDKDGNGIHLGKAFMLEQTWFGHWSTAKPDAEEKLYAKAYNRTDILPSSRRRRAVAMLNEKYRNILRKYYKRYASKGRSVSKIKAYQRLASRRWNKIIGGGRS